MSQNDGNGGYVANADDFSAFLRWWREERKRHSEPYGPRVDRFTAWAASSGLPLSPSTLDLWLRYRERNGASASTMCGYYFACKVALQAWQREVCKNLPGQEAALQGWKLDQDLAAIRLPKVMKGKRAKMIAELQQADLEKVIRSTTPRIGAYIEFLSVTGLRVQEMADLRLTWVRPFDPEKSFLTVMGKGNKERAVWVSNALIARIRRIFHGSVYLFETKSGRQYDQDNIRKEIKRTFLREAGIGLTPHNLRHYLATRLLRLGFSSRAVADLFGHTSPITLSVSYDVSEVPAEALIGTKPHGERGRRKKSAKETV